MLKHDFDHEFLYYFMLFTKDPVQADLRSNRNSYLRNLPRSYFIILY